MNAALKLKEKAANFLEDCPIMVIVFLLHSEHQNPFEYPCQHYTQLSCEQVDPMDDRANHAFAALPERIYVVLDGRIAYQGGLGPFDYKIEEVEEFLSKRK